MALTEARKAFLAKAWREAISEDTSVQTAHLLAPQIVEETLYTVEADAQDEADRRQTLRGVKRDRMELVVPVNDEFESLDLGGIINLTHDRYGLSGGKKFVITEIEATKEDNADALILTVWG